MKNQEFYISNIRAIERIKEIYFSELIIDNIAKTNEQENELMFYIYFDFLKDFSRDMILLEQIYQEKINGTKVDFSTKGRGTVVWRNDWSSGSSIFSNALHHVFGQDSCHTSPNLDYMNIVSSIRIGLELRLRRILGATALYQKSNGTLHPIPISVILDYLKKNEDRIDCPLPISNLIRINSWSNLFIHSGKKDFVWIPIFVYHYLIPIFLDGSIKMDKNTLDGLHNEIIQTQQNSQDFGLYGFTPNEVVK